MRLDVKRASLSLPPVESVTITLTAEEIVDLRNALGQQTQPSMRLTHWSRKFNDAGLDYYTASTVEALNASGLGRGTR